MASAWIRLARRHSTLWTNARGAVTDLGETLDLKGRVERNPYGMVAAAIGVGYVLGGGLFTPLTARIIKLGVRLAMLPFVKDELLGMAETALQGFQAGQSAAGLVWRGRAGQPRDGPAAAHRPWQHQLSCRSLTSPSPQTWSSACSESVT